MDVISGKAHAAARGRELAHITLDGKPREVPAGPTVVSELKRELQVNPAFVLFLIHGHEKRPLGDAETIDVKSGLHFEAVPGGGVS